MSSAKAALLGRSDAWQSKISSSVDIALGCRGGLDFEMECDQVKEETSLMQRTTPVRGLLGIDRYAIAERFTPQPELTHHRKQKFLLPTTISYATKVAAEC